MEMLFKTVYMNRPDTAKSIHTNTQILMYPKSANPNMPRCVGFALKPSSEGFF